MISFALARKQERRPTPIGALTMDGHLAIISQMTADESEVKFVPKNSILDLPRVFNSKLNLG
jgi:hypothetical protein